MCGYMCQVVYNYQKRKWTHNIFFEYILNVLKHKQNRVKYNAKIGDVRHEHQNELNYFFQIFTDSRSFSSKMNNCLHMHNADEHYSVVYCIITFSACPKFDLQLSIMGDFG